MDTITIDELKQFLPSQSGWHISMYVPTEYKGQATEQNRIRYKNLLQEAEQRLISKEMRTPEVRQLLEPAQQLLEKPGFWRYQSHGLAVFLTADTFVFFRLPLSFNELVVISDSFHIKPLLPFFTSDGHFYILALSQKQVRLMEGTRHSVDEINLENMPTSLSDALTFDRLNKKLQFHTSTSTPISGERAGMFHGHDPSDETKAKILKWFHRIDDVLPTLLVGGQSPIVLAGVDYLFPLYKQANTYPHLVEEGIPGNPEELKPEELHAQAWPIVEPVFQKVQENAAARYHQMSDTEKTTTDLPEAVLAAHHGRVADLFVPIDVHLWGTADLQGNQVQIHKEKQPGDRDLLDLAAIQTILNGGSVFAVKQEEIPGGETLAAVLRY